MHDSLGEEGGGGAYQHSTTFVTTGAPTEATYGGDSPTLLGKNSGTGISDCVSPRQVPTTYLSSTVRRGVRSLSLRDLPPPPTPGPCARRVGPSLHLSCYEVGIGRRSEPSCVGSGTRSLCHVTTVQCVVLM